MELHRDWSPSRRSDARIIDSNAPSLEINDLLRHCCWLKKWDARKIQKEVNKIFSSFSGAELCFHLLPTPFEAELSITVAGHLDLDEVVSFPLRDTKAGETLARGKPVFTKNVSPEHLALISCLSKTTAKSCLFVPIPHPSSDSGISCVICLVNKRWSTISPSRVLGSPIAQENHRFHLIDGEFSNVDVDYINVLCSYFTPILIKKMELEREQLQNSRKENLLKEARNIMSSITDPNCLIKSFLLQAVTLLNAERCNYNLVDTVENKFTVFTSIAATRPEREPRETKKVEFTRTFAGYTLASGEPLNVRDTSQYPQMTSAYLHRGEPKPHNVLCVPVKSAEVLLGVLEVVNKKGIFYFSETDVSLLEDISVYFSISTLLRMDSTRLVS